MTDTMKQRVVEEEKAPPHRIVIPWADSAVLSGVGLLQSRKLTKGLGFTAAERRALKLEGLLPSLILTQDQQVKRVMSKMRGQESDLKKYVYILGLANRNEMLFYRCLILYAAELMPIVYTPTVGLACQKFGHIYRQPRGIQISLEMKGRVREVIRNWPNRDIRACVFTDGERILGLGDLGTYGLGIPIGKLMLYTAVGGVDPRQCLPVVIDCGTNNEKLLADPEYTGVRHERTRGRDYDDLIDEFITAMQETYGNKVLLQFEDFANQNAFRLLNKYRDTCCCFNDDIQGTAGVVLAGLYASCKKLNKPLSEHRILFFGAGSAGIGIADLIAFAISKDENMPLETAREKISLFDSRGLVYEGRATGGISSEKSPYAHKRELGNADVTGLAEAVAFLRPTVLIGVSAIAQTFTKAVCENMAASCDVPVIMALSNPTSKAECTAEQAYTWTKGKCLFASGSPFEPVVYEGTKHVPGQGNNSFIFPGVGLAVVVTEATRVTDDMFHAAAKALGNFVTEDNLEAGLLYPPNTSIRDVTPILAAAVAEVAYRDNLATLFPKPANLVEFMANSMYDSVYPNYA